MSDTSAAALLAWLNERRRIATDRLGLPMEAAKWDALAAIVRAHQTLEAEIEKLPRWRISDVEWVQVADVLRLLAARGAQR